MPPPLVGRDDEVALLGALVREGVQRGAALVLHGDPGVGKSSLLAVAAREAADAGRVVLHVTGVESEAQVPWSGLHRLLGPVLPEAEALPLRLREALLSAFGLTEPASPSYLVGYAALELVAEIAAATPVVLVIDDAHWLDPSSASALAFLARRIEDEPVVALFAVRDDVDSPVADGSLPVLLVAALDEQQAALVLEPGTEDLPGSARREILRLAQGNPLALVELPKAWSPTDAGDLAPGTMTARLERAFARRIEDLPDDVRLAALVAAAHDSDELTEVVGVVDGLLGAGRGEDLLHAAASAGVMVVDESAIRFRHPLVRSACYRRALPSERRRVHAVLAESSTMSVERRTWHRALSTVGPAEDVAAGLEVAAESALRQGSPRVAVAALTRAANLSGTGRQRGRRLVAATELAFEAGMHQQGTALLVRAGAEDLSEEDRLRLSWLTEVFGDRAWSGASKVAALCGVASRLAEHGQREQALKMLLNLALRCWWSNPDDDTRRTLVETVEGLGADPDDPTVVSVLAYAAPLERGRVVESRLAAAAPDSVRDPADALNLGTAATAIGAFPLAAPLLGSAVARSRSRGDMVMLQQGLVARLLTDHHLGRWRAARTTAEEVRRLTADTGEPIWGMAAAATEAMVAAAQGDEEGVDRLGRTAEEFFLPLGAHPFLAPVELARGLVAVAHGRHEQALHHVRGVHDPASPLHHQHARHWGAVDHVAAAVAMGHREEALQVVADLESAWAVSGSPLLGASLLLTRPLVADDDGAESLFRAGLAGSGLVPWPFLHARHLLAFGTWQRRHRRVRDSRAPLRAARDLFDALGAGPWSEQARRELRASGEAGRERGRGADDQLSPQERQIAQLAARGLTNREIGQHLYLSHRTVGSHLYRIFPKLGITTRGQLVTALGGAADDGSA